MRIDRVEIDGFGKLNHVSLDFSSGFNLILGDNESGKSTLCEFLLAMFYELPNDKKTADSYENGRRKYRPWDTESFGGKVFFTGDDGTKYLLEKTFGKTKNSDRARLLFADTWEPAGDAQGVGERFFGLGREGFIKTLYVKSLDANSGVGATEILSRLSNMETGMDEDISYDKIRVAMEKAHGQIITKTGRGGRLPTLYETQRSLEAEKHMLSRKQDQLSNLEQEAAKLQHADEALQKQIAGLEQVFCTAKEHEAYAVAKQAEHSRGVLSARYQTECENLAEKKLQLTQLKQQSEDGVDAGALVRVKELEKRLRLAENAAATAETARQAYIAEQTNKLEQRRRLRKRIAMCMLIITALLAVLCFCLGLEWVAVIVFLVGAMGIVLLDVLSNRTKAPAEEEMPRSDGAAEDLRKQIVALCTQCGVQTVEGMENLVRAQTQARETIASLTAEISRLEKETEDILKSISQIRLPEEAVYSDEAISYEGATSDDIREEIRSLSEKQARGKERLHAIRIQLTQETAGGRTLPEVETELLATNEEIALLEKKEQAFQLAEEWLYKAHLEIKENFAPRLNQKTADIFSAFTGEKYSQVRVGDGFLLHYKNENGEVTESGSLSSGTYDLLYIAQRIGVLKALFEENVPPMILDDAFQQMDDLRHRTIVSYLAGSGAVGQVIAFTCHRESAKTLQQEKINLIDLNEKGVLDNGLQN